MESYVAQASGLVLGLIAVPSTCEVLERWSMEFDKEYRWHGVVLITVQTPTVEPMTRGTQLMPPQAGFDRDVFGNIFTTRQFVHRIRVAYWKSASTCLEVDHNAKKLKYAQLRMLCQRRSASREHETYRKPRPLS